MATTDQNAISPQSAALPVFDTPPLSRRQREEVAAIVEAELNRMLAAGELNAALLQQLEVFKKTVDAPIREVQKLLEKACIQIWKDEL